MHTNVIIELIHPLAKVPTYAHDGDACADLYAVSYVELKPNEPALLKLGFKMELDMGYEAQIRARSSMGLRNIYTHPGTIDYAYRKEVGVILVNHTNTSYYINPGDRIAQMKIEKVLFNNFVTGKVTPTARGGFGSSGT